MRLTSCKHSGAGCAARQIQRCHPHVSIASATHAARCMGSVANVPACGAGRVAALDCPPVFDTAGAVIEVVLTIKIDVCTPLL